MKAEDLKKEIVEAYGQGSDGSGWNAWDNRDDLSYRMDEYANQRVIEELDLLRQKLTHISFTAHCIDEINDRIKELKQE